MKQPNPSGHTPGPWVGCIRFTPIGMDHDFNLAWLTAEPGSPRDLEARANARLIAAAPDLLAACQALLNTYFDYHDAHSLTEPVTGASGNAADMAIDAIAKATGQ